MLGPSCSIAAPDRSRLGTIPDPARDRVNPILPRAGAVLQDNQSDGVTWPAFVGTRRISRGHSQRSQSRRYKCRGKNCAAVAIRPPHPRDSNIQRGSRRRIPLYSELVSPETVGRTSRMIKGSEIRKANHPIEALLLDRWSPRAMSGEGVSTDELMRLFEAGRWAPSSFNAQQWRALYARRETEHWPTFLGLLVEGNRRWAQYAAVLVLFISRETFEYNGEESITHSYDCGAAWENFALQGFSQGLVVHAASPSPSKMTATNRLYQRSRALILSGFTNLLIAARILWSTSSCVSPAA